MSPTETSRALHQEVKMRPELGRFEKRMANAATDTFLPRTTIHKGWRIDGGIRACRASGRELELVSSESRCAGLAVDAG